MSIFCQIKEQYDILDYLIEKGLPFKHVGKRNVLNCPLPGHSDNNASFNVYEDGSDQRIKCYGCGFSGDLFDFVAKMEGKTNWEVANEMAMNFGIAPAAGSKEESDLANFQEVHRLVMEAEDACVRAQNALCGHPEATSYLRDTRGLSVASCAYFRLGWNSAKNCITIPLMDKHGRVMTFVENYFGDYLPLSDGKKYVVPSNDIPIAKIGKYKKSAYFHNLWGLNLVEDNTIYLVEGYFDVIAMKQLGYDNCLAITTALMTPDQIQELYKLTDSSTNFVFVPDTDIPGFNAVVKNIDSFKSVDIGKYRGVQIVNLAEEPSIKDANDWLLKKNGPLPEPFCSEIYKALKVCNPIYNKEVRLWQLRQIADNASPIARRELARHFADDLGIPEDELIEQLLAENDGSDGNYGTAALDLNPVKEYIMECNSATIHAGFGKKVDDIILGFRLGDLVGLGGRSNTGKTAIVCDYIWNQLEQGSSPPTVFFSLEMRKEEIMMRLMQQYAELTTKELMNAFTNDPGYNPWGTLCPLQHVYIWDQPGMTIEGMKEVIRDLETSYFKCPVQQVIIDHAQLIKNDAKNSYEKMTRTSLELLNFAKVQKAVVLVLSQMSRGAGQNGGVEVSMDGSRDSGAFEEVLDFYFTIWRPWYALSEEERRAKTEIEDAAGDGYHESNEIKLKIAKSRRGGRDTCVDLYQTPHLRMLYNDANLSPYDLVVGGQITDVPEIPEVERMFANTGN